MPANSSNQSENPHATRRQLDESLYTVPDGSRFVTHLDDQHVLQPWERVLPQSHGQPVSAAEHQIETDTNLDPGSMHEATSWSCSQHSFSDVEGHLPNYNFPIWPDDHLASPEACFNGASDVEPQGWHPTGDQAYSPRSVIFEREHWTNIAEDNFTIPNDDAAQSHAYMNEGVEPDQPGYPSEMNSRVCIPRDTWISDTKMQRTQDERRFVCGQDGCTVTCRRESDLQRHKNTIHELSPVIHVCEDQSCDFSHRRKDKMLEHQKTTAHNFRIVDIIQPELTS